VTHAPNRGKIFRSIACGLLVGAPGAVMQWIMVPHDPALMINVFAGDVVGGLGAMIVCLALHIQHKEALFVRALSCVAIITELNHRIRSALFPLCLAAQKTGGSETSQLADEAVEGISAALREATADAISDYSRNGQ
jgi:hypothetical protein